MKKAMYLGSLVFLFAGMIAVPAMGARINVGGATGLATIQAGIDAAVNGDVVLVAAGTYRGVGNRDLDFAGKLITLRSVSGPTRCTINGGGVARGFVFTTKETRGAKVIGFTIRNCNGTAAGGGGGGGGAFLINGASPTISRCIIDSNTATSGGAMSIGNSNALISDCVFTSNTATRQGGAIDLAPPSSPSFINCTMRANTAPTGFGGAFWTALDLGIGANARVANCILWDNSKPELVGHVSLGINRIAVTFSDVQQNITGRGNIRVSPLFVNGTGKDLHLRPTSPCVNKGSRVAGLPTVDLDGKPRVQGARVDMGAYEQ